jgi:hypothetical protein
LAHHRRDFNLEGPWTFNTTGHGKGPCDGVGAVIKSTATPYLLKGEPQASFSSPKEFVEWCFQKNDRMMVAKPRPINASNSIPARMPEPNRPVEIRWLSADDINSEANQVLIPRWSELSSKGTFSYLTLMSLSPVCLRLYPWDL